MNLSEAQQYLNHQLRLEPVWSRVTDALGEPGSVESVEFSPSWHPNGQYIAHAGHDPYIYIFRFADILEYSNDDIPVAHKSWAGDNAEYIDFNADGSFLSSAHQNGLIKLWVWMGEDPALNEKRHEWVKTHQKDAQK